MLKIAICDDDFVFCTELEELLYIISRDIHAKIDIDIYYDALKFKNRIQEQQDYDLIFLDIELNDILGSEIGHFIRDELKWENVGIIYISNKSQYALSLFKTRPHDFIIKPITYDNVRETFASFVQLNHNKNKYFQYKNGSSSCKVSIDDILYFESDNRIIKIHCVNEIVTFYGKLVDILKELDDVFLSIHRSFIVNCDKIINFRYADVELVNKEVLPISQSKRQEVKKILMKKWADKD